MPATLNSYYPLMGCDPEFFFKSGDKIIEASKILPKDGLAVGSRMLTQSSSNPASPKFIIDGVQAELNPRPYACRANLGNELKECFRLLNTDVLQKQKVGISFEGMIELPKEDMDKLTEESKKFGCAPSKNMYTKKTSVITVDPSKYRFRSAGGHIHISGDGSRGNMTELFHKKPGLTVRLLDLVVGNTCVLVDRDPYQVERRKVYGRAGEYRLPEYGIEYRTLSNFWLQSYQLMSLTFGLVRQAVSIAMDIYRYEKDGRHTVPKSEHRELMRLVSKKEVEEAINSNDFDLAKRNFDRIKDYLVDIVGDDNSHYPINKYTIKPFEFFVSKGMSHWFKKDPLDHWVNNPEGHGHGWEAFCENVITPEMSQEKIVKVT